MSAKPPDSSGTPRPPSSTSGGGAQSAKDIVGTVIHGKYEVLQLLSQGGMGVVYKARHKALDTLVALKVLLKAEEPGAQQRFLSEARLASKVRHPNTVYISDVGVLEDGRAFLEMEFLEGRTLAAELRRGPIEVLRACSIAMQMARGLQAVHDKGIIHRDMKPDNVFLMEQDGDKDFVKIVDFGIAKVARNIDTPSEGSDALGAAAELEKSADPQVRSGGYTQPGKVMGTPGYMAPEQLQAARLDVRVDQYAIGCMLYQMLSGKPVHHSRGMQQLMMKHMTDPAQPLRKRAPTLNIPESVDKLVMRLLAKEPQDRFGSMRELEQELQREIDKLTPTPSSGEAGAKTAPAVAKKRMARWPFMLVAGFAVFIVGFVGYRFIYLPRMMGTNGPTAMTSRELLALRQRALDNLRADLRGDVTELRLTAISALSQSRDPENRKDLEAALAMPEAQTRIAAASALGNLGDRGAVPVLAALLDPNAQNAGGAKTIYPQLKVAAAGSLRQLGDPRGQQFLVQTLSSNDADLQLRAALLFCELGPSDVQKILQTYLARSGLPDNTQKNILVCLARAGDNAALQRLRNMLKELEGTELRLSAAVRLAQLGDADGFKALRDLMRKGGGLKIVAAHELALLDEPDGLDLFRQYAVNKEVPRIARELACNGLGAVGEAEDAWRIAGLLDDKERPLKQAGARAIVQITGRDPALLSDQSLVWARAALSDSDALVRESAVAILGDSLSEGAVTLLAGLLKDKDSRVRRSAVVALGRRKDEAAVRALRTALSDNDRGVRTQALRSLLRMGEVLNSSSNRRAVAQLKEALSDVAKASGAVDRADRILAASLLLRLGDVSQIKRLREWLYSSDVELRRLALEHLPLDQNELATLLKDKEPLVRFIAARRLAALGDRRAVPVLDEAAARGGADGVVAYGLLKRLGAPQSATSPFERLLQESNPALRIEAVEALSGLPPVDAEPLLVRAARDREPTVRLMVAEVAAELVEKQGSKEGFSVVQRLASDPNQAVRARAAALLARLLGARIAAATAGANRLAPPVANNAAGASNPPPTAATNATPDGGSAPADGGSAPADGGEVGDGGDPGEETDTPPTGGGTHGTLTISAASYVQYQIDKRSWQQASEHPVSLTIGDHTVNSLAGTHTVTIAADKPTQLKIETSQVEQLAHAGLDSFVKSDYKKAQRQMEKAIALCSRDRDRQHAPVCAGISFELVSRLGEIHEKQKEWPQAMTEYQRLLTLGDKVRGRSDVKARAHEAVERLAPKLGQLIVAKRTKNRCQEETVWMPPGTHFIKVDKKFEKIEVKARAVLKVGQCS